MDHCGTLQVTFIQSELVLASIHKIPTYSLVSYTSYTIMIKFVYENIMVTPIITITVTLTLTLTITLTQILTLTQTVILIYNPAN